MNIVFLKRILALVVITFFAISTIIAQEKNQNIVVICIDGFRWQEVFTGADSLLINDPVYVKDTALVKEQFWAETPAERRQLLMPFLWNVVAKKGQLYGDQLFDNKMTVKNAFCISYPGYSEMLSGHPDALLIPDLPINNRNTNVLEYLDQQPVYNGKVAAFTSWNIFPYIFNKKHTSFFVNSGYQKMDAASSDTLAFVNETEDGIKRKKNTRYDLLTFLNAKQYISSHHPKVLFLGFGETDLFAHANRYDLYLQQANNIDKMIYELWYFIQTDPFYKNNTSLIITTDHGRGEYASSWHDHNSLVKGSKDIWLALMGPFVPQEGEVKTKARYYEKQIASTITMLLNVNYENNKTAKPLDILKSNNTATSKPMDIGGAEGIIVNSATH
ncbi:MAG TPA: hypothetical protein VEV62_08855 [Parafilimonas sp.]|nr:hypothetical protein [Parafilimonas sp.]